MALELLSCSICPKQPAFSDTSHLLTHVSSKGHLSFLHKLQVRSHLEIGAGVQLATYNQWYQQYGLGQLLSERLLQKEAKKANKGVVGPVKKKIKQENIFNVDELGVESSPLQSRSKTSHRGPGRKPKRGKRQPVEEDFDSDLDYSPGPKPRRALRSYALTPMKRLSSIGSFHTPFVEYPGEIDPTLTAAFDGPDNRKLKGTIWPGMNCFDAATEEEQRRRNQKKDGSVVKRMERFSKMVRPTEVLYSPGGTMRKQRHIDDLEDIGSLIEGESPLVKQPLRRKRKPLAKRSAQVSGFVDRKPSVFRTEKERLTVDMTGLPPMSYIPSSSTHTSYGLPSRYSPTADENMEFKLTVGNMSSRKRRENFTIFNDDTDRLQHGLPNLNPAYIVPVQPRLSFKSASWLQPQYQQPLYYDNHYTNYRPVYPTYSDLQDVALGKENMFPLIGRSAERENQTANPLTWKSTTPDNQASTQSSDTTFGGLLSYFAGTSNLADPFGYTKNPLADAMAHFGTDQTAEQVRQAVQSPDGTISENEIDNQKSVLAPGK